MNKMYKKSIALVLIAACYSAIAGQYSEFCAWENSTAWGQNLSCQAPNIAFGICGSGENTDCNNGQTATQLYCCSEPTVGAPSNEKLYSTSNWGERLSCPSGQVVIDYCGSGKNKDCGEENTNTITCANVDSIKLQDSTTTWYSTSVWGKQMVCPNAMVLTGICGSGKNKDCPNGTTNEVQCTTYTINN